MGIQYLFVHWADNISKVSHFFEKIMDFEKLKEAFQISKNESVIVTFRVPLNVNDRALPFGKFNIEILDDVNYDLYAEVKVKL